MHVNFSCIDHTDTHLPSRLEDIIRQAGTLMLNDYVSISAVGNRVEGVSKKADGSLVTDVDLKIQEFLIERLNNLLPATFFAEESSDQAGDACSGYTWVIDPLDGTTNFVYGIPYFCISVALTLDGVPVIAALYNPVLQEYFHARKGAGAWLNHRSIHVSRATDLNESLLFAGMPYGKGPAFNAAHKRLEGVARQAFAFRHLGAIALDLAYVACGRSDGIFFEGLRWWDVAAGILILQEAGGIATTYDGKPIGPDYTSFMGANISVHKLLSSLLSSQV